MPVSADGARSRHASDVAREPPSPRPESRARDDRGISRDAFASPYHFQICCGRAEEIADTIIYHDNATAPRRREHSRRSTDFAGPGKHRECEKNFRAKKTFAR
jgi:hypothetical protein